MMNDADKDLLYSETVKAGKRIYYFDVKQSRNGDRYVAITESKRIADGPTDNPHVTFEKHKLFLYKEDYDKFVAALNKVIDVASSDNIRQQEKPQAEEQSAEPEAKPDNPSAFDIQF